MRSLAVKGGLPNMRGRKTLVLNCRCCVARDLRDKLFKEIHEREMHLARRGEKEYN